MVAVLVLGALALGYAVFFLVPPAEGLGYLVRIAFFHIPVAWVSVLAFFLAALGAGQYLRTKDLYHDCRSAAAAWWGFIFCLLATASGAVFAKLTWGAYWNWDPRQTSIFVLLLIYGAYLTLRSAIEDEFVRAKISAIYALLAFVTVPFLVFILPRAYFSLHPEPVLNRSGRVEMEAVMLATLGGAIVFFTLLFWQLWRRRVGQTCQLKDGAD